MSISKTINLFSFPVHCSRINIDNKALIDLAKELKQKETGQIKSNVGGWHSEFVDLSNNTLSPLIDEILKSADELYKQMDFVKNKTTILNGWFICNKFGSFNKPHVHTNCLFSGVYYVKADGNEGDLVFKNPSINLQYHFNKNLVKSYNDKNSYEISIRPEAGKLLVFPSWIEHYVCSNLTSKDRVIFSFNIGIANES